MEIPKKIQEAINEDRLIIFAGSGLSARFHLPSWNKLVEDVIKEIDKSIYNDFLPLLRSGMLPAIEILDKLQSEHTEIKKYILNNFKINTGDFSTHKKIIELSGKIITTNYDNAFEQASNNSINPAVYTSDFNISEINKSNKPYIFKLHGSYTEPDHCVIFSEDYKALYSNETSAKIKLKSIFSEKVILFIGFSFNDPDINLIFNNLDSVFGNNNKHFVLTKEPANFEKFKFLEILTIDDYQKIDLFIDKCLEIKIGNQNPINVENKAFINDALALKINEPKKAKIALLRPQPLDLDLNEEILRVVNSFDNLDADLCIGSLNIKTLSLIEDFDILIIVTRTFKSNLYIEGDNLKSSLMSPSEICSNIPNDRIPIVFVTNDKIEPVLGYSIINVNSFKNAVINRFIYRVLKQGELNFNEENILIYLQEFYKNKIPSGRPIVSSIYNNTNLDISKKIFSSVIGRVEEQASIALKILSINRTNKLLNIKASGGIGKTTLIKKVAYELYNRGYYRDGVTFVSCENITTFLDFEEILISGFKLSNILNFKDYLKENYVNSKIDLLVILDNFETVVNKLNNEDFSLTIEYLKFATDYADIVVTSREKLSVFDDFEDVYSLTSMTTDDAFALFQKNHGPIRDKDEIKILRQEILEDLLNNNPLAINLVTKSRTRIRSIRELSLQLKKHFFESINEDVSHVYNEDADLNIERTKSIYQSINYSYTTLNNKERIAFELLSLFPDGISLSNFKKCFAKSISINNINDKDLRVIRDKSLIEDNNGILQLQPIIRRFANYQFSLKDKELKKKYCLDAYAFNCYILDIIEMIDEKESISQALRFFSFYKNNLLHVLSYIKEVEISKKGIVRNKLYLVSYIYKISSWIVSEKQINEFVESIRELYDYFKDVPNAKTLIDVLDYSKTYFYKEFDEPYKQLTKILPVSNMETRDFKNEDLLEYNYNHTIANIHSMEGYALQRVNSHILNDNDVSFLMDGCFYYLGIVNNIARNKLGFYFFEYELMFKRLNIKQLESYIDSLFFEEHLQTMQCTYTLSKVKKIEYKKIQKLVVTNPYTKGLKALMFAFITKDIDEKNAYFKDALRNLFHIKYYYLEALYYYCLFLKEVDLYNYRIKLAEGLELSGKFYYQFLNFQFKNIDSTLDNDYEFDYSYYPVPLLEEYVKKHNKHWEANFAQYDIDF